MAQPSCESRIDAEWAARAIDLLDPDTDLAEYGLSFDYVRPDTFRDQPEGYFCYLLSTGGPSDELRFYTSPQFVVQRVEYWFLDWFDGAHRDVSTHPAPAHVWDYFADTAPYLYEQAFKD